MRKLISILIIGLFFRALAGSPPGSVETYLNGRKLVIDKFAALTPVQRKQREEHSAMTANILFFRAQQARLRDEIQEARISESSLSRDWQKQAARITRQRKEAALRVMAQFERTPPHYAIRCMSDIDASDTSGEMKNFLTENLRVYSKSSGGALGNSGRLETEALSNLAVGPTRTRSAGQLILAEILNKPRTRPLARPRFSDAVLNNRLPKTLPPPMPTQAHVSKTEAKSLGAFGINPNRSVPAQKDLSDRFTIPKLQPPHTAMCAGYAISSDMETVLNNGALAQLYSVSPTYAYKALVESERGGTAPSGLCTLIKRNADPLAGVGSPDYSISQALQNLSGMPICSTDDQNASRLKTTQYYVSSFKSFNLQNPNLDYVKALISSGVTPMAVIGSERRQENENWIYLKSGGKYEHIVNIVGYGASRDPDCLNQTEYLIIRDSLGKTPIHYRVSATDFLRSTFQFHKVTRVNEDVLGRLNPLNSVGPKETRPAGAVK